MSEQILLVDGELNRCRLLQRRLERLGLAVTSVGSLSEAVEACELPPRVMLVDLALLCGPNRDQAEVLVSQMLGTRALICRQCGRLLREAAPGRGGAVTCCGEPMGLVETESEEEASW